MEKLSYRLPHSTLRKGEVLKYNDERTVAGMEVQVCNHEKEKVEIMENLSFSLPHYTVQKCQMWKDNGGRTIAGVER